VTSHLNNLFKILDYAKFSITLDLFCKHVKRMKTISGESYWIRVGRKVLRSGDMLELYNKFKREIERRTHDNR